MLVSRDRSFQLSGTGVSTKTGVRDGSVFLDQRWLQMGQQALSPAQGGGIQSSGSGMSITWPQQRCSRKRPALCGTTVHQTRHSGASIGRAVSELCVRFKSEVSGTLSAVSQETTQAVVWQPTTTLTISRSETSWKHSRDMPRDC